MNVPPIPEDEAKRLAALRSLNVLDTPIEERFDRLTRLACRLFNVPIALVSLVDEKRQWFKSAVGMDISESPRENSFCGHAILEDDVFIVPDAAKDPRFADNPMVLNEPNIRFYAGCPLRAPDGSKLGTLCIIDRKPRKMDADDIVALHDLASTVERELVVAKLATQDELTGILNRRGFLTHAGPTLHLCAREHIPVSLAFFDLDKFKSINDVFGHAEGDRALNTFAQQMQHAFRESDLYARLGGDEFVALLTNMTREQAESTVARFVDTMKEFCQKENRGYELPFTYGIVEYDANKHESIEQLLAAGDDMMYRNK